MLMLVKSLYSLVLPPGGFILAFLGIALWLFLRADRKTPAIVLTVLSAALWLVSTPAAGSLLLRPLEDRYAPPARTDGDVIVLLMGGATPDTPNIDGSLGHVSGSTASRLLTAARLQRETGLPLVVSGGQVFASSGNESDIAVRELLGIGIPKSSIVQERKSRTTAENAEYSAMILKERGWKEPLLVTSAAHMPRAVADFKRSGIDVVPVPTNYLAGRKPSADFIDWIPSSQGLSLAGSALKEYLGLLAGGFST